MASDYLSHPEADDELENAFRYYNERSYKAPVDFVNDFDMCIDRIIANPLAGHPCYKTYRRFNLRQFPHAIIYRPEGHSIYVIALIHERQRPLYWLHRIDSDKA